MGGGEGGGGGGVPCFPWLPTAPSAANCWQGMACTDQKEHRLCGVKGHTVTHINHTHLRPCSDVLIRLL